MRISVGISLSDMHAKIMEATGFTVANTAVSLLKRLLLSTSVAGLGSKVFISGFGDP